jgi:hypothetical protein
MQLLFYFSAQKRQHIPQANHNSSSASAYVVLWVQWVSALIGLAVALLMLLITWRMFYIRSWALCFNSATPHHIASTKTQRDRASNLK